jgi:hypothetical protein
MKANLYKSFNDPTTLVLVLLAILGLYGGWIYTQKSVGVDYYVAWTVADTLRSDEEYRVYDRRDKRRLVQDYRKKARTGDKTSRHAAVARLSFPEVTASPFLYTVVYALSTRNYETSLTIWGSLSLVGFTAAILLFCRLLGFSAAATLVLYVPLIFWGIALQSDLRVGNINSIQLGLVALAFFLLSRDTKTPYLFSAGALIAMIVVMKPNLAPVSLLVLSAWLIRGQGRKFLIGLLGMTAGALFALGTSSLVFGDVGIWLEWLDRLFRLTRIDMPAAAGNYDMLRSLDRTTGSSGLRLGARGQVVLAMAICAITLGFLWWGRKNDKSRLEQESEAGRKRELIEYAQLIAMGCVVQMLISPLVWVHYYVLAIPMLIVAFQPWSRAPTYSISAITLQRLVPALIFVASLYGPHWKLPVDDVNEVHAAVMLVSVAILYVIGLWQLRFQPGG